MRRLFSIAFLVMAVVVAALKVAEWTSEEWWMDSMGFRSAQALYWRWRVEAFMPAFGLWMLVMGSNARLAWHNARWRDVSLPLLGPRALAGRNQISSEDRVRLDLLARRGEQVFIGMSALLCGMAAANQFDLWVLALHPPSFGTVGSGANATFLVGVWPALLWAWNAFGALLGFTLGLVVTIAAFEGVLDFDTHGLRVGDATARHLAFLMGLILMWVGVRCGLSVLGEPINFGWSANGISGSYERTFTNPVRVLFLISSPLLALWFARTAPHNTLRAMVVALFWSGSALFLPLMAPSFGRAVWAPSAPGVAETLREEQRQHIIITRRAWGLDHVQQHQLKLTASDFGVSLAESEAPGAMSEKTPGLVVWPSEGLRAALHENDTGRNSGPTGQGRRASELYIVRQGRSLKARIIETDAVTTSATSPLLLESDPSRAGSVEAARRELGAVIMQSPLSRISTNSPNPGMPTPDDGSMLHTQARVRSLAADRRGSVGRDNLLMKLPLALRFGDRGLLEGDDPVTWHLDPLERVEALAPFVWWTDAQPHPVWMRVSGEKLEHMYWLVEGCFVSRSFPHAAMMPAGDEWGNVNYARQSVLGVCDAATGETSFFLFDPSEPFSRAWNELLPGFFRPIAELPAPLRAGTRLSTALLSAQSVVWSRYHGTPSGDEVEEWAQNKDEWRSFDAITSSERDTLVQQVLIERGGKPGLEQLAAFATWGGTVTSSTVPATGGENRAATALLALLSARDEGEAIWQGRGQAPMWAWRAAKPFALPLSGSPPESGLASPFPPERFDKLALLPLLDSRCDCIGMQISRGQAERRKQANGYSPWFLTNRVVSTRTRFMESPTGTSSVREAKTLATLKALWRSWKEARAVGRWDRVEDLEAEMNRVLSR